MDTVRPKVDPWWLDLLQKTKLPKQYFHEKENGVVRITLPLIPILGQTVSLWKKEVVPIAAELSKILLAKQSTIDNKQEENYAPHFV
jgi:hypothetical protein